MTGKNSVGYNNVAAYTTYGTNRANAYKILEDSLNLRDVRIYDTVEDAVSYTHLDVYKRQGQAHSAAGRGA